MTIHARAIRKVNGKDRTGPLCDFWTTATHSPNVGKVTCEKCLADIRVNQRG
jgi:hypothetical protein